MERLDDHALNIYTDGSGYEHPRRGGYAWLFVTTGEDGHEVVNEFSPNGVLGTNSQEMELTACVEALKVAGSPRSPLDLERFSKIVIFTDSITVHDGFSAAKFQWSQNRYMRRSGPPVLNADLWKELIRIVKSLGLPVHIEWVRGKTSPHTKRVDELAKASADRAQPPRVRPATVRTVRRKRTSASAKSGSVPVEGQEIEIQIITAEWLRVQRCLRYRYEVMSEGPDHGKADWLFSDEALQTRNVYRVRLNDNPDYPQIEEVIEVVGPAQRGSAGAD